MHEYHQHGMSKEELKENALLSFVVRLRRLFLHHRRQVWIGLAVVVVVAGFLAYRAIASSQAENDASTAFEKVALLLRSENAQQQIGDADKQLEDIIKKWPDTLSAAKASFYLGNIKFGMENFAGAIESFGRAANFKTGIYLHPAALVGIANCHEQQGDLAKAIDYYDRVIVLSKSFGYRDISRLGKVRCLGIQGKIADARKTLGEITRETSAFSAEVSRLSAWLDMKNVPAGQK